MLSVAFAPMFPWPAIGVLAAVAALLFGLRPRARGAGWRLAAAAVLLAALANPSLVEEERVENPDVVAVVVDASASQRVGSRREQTDAALAALAERLRGMRGVETRIVRAGSGRDGTKLFDAVQRTFANVPRDRIGGTFLITDGQVHDAGDPPVPGPVHALLSGSPGEIDRRLEIENAPRFGLVGKSVEIDVLIRGGAGAARIALTQDGKPKRTVTAPVGRSHRISLDLDHAGANVLQLEAEPLEGEIARVNNRAVVQVNGVRERLRVLLVSGEPHAGERVWRNFLKADPSVDLIHFTILRPPRKQDSTPVRELSLIAFPTRELFDEKIAEFDLIIFDRYRRRGVLPDLYLENIVRYVENGGAFLTAVGPSFATELSLFETPLGNILPGRPTGRILKRGLRPRLSDYGFRHPVTADLADETRWGRWFRQIEADAGRGRVLMNGPGDRPLLILDRVGDGRVAQLLSDHIWLWARGFENGGPHSEILRRLAHWLMKEPDLEEEAIGGKAEGGELVIVRRSAAGEFSEVTVTTPSGAVRKVTLKADGRGRAQASIPAEETGLYRLEDESSSAVTAVGNPNPREFSDMRATAEPLAATTAASGGGLHWLKDGFPDLRRVRPGATASGERWMGVVANRDYRVANIREIPLLPAIAVLILGLGALLWAWRREGD